MDVNCLLLFMCICDWLIIGLLVVHFCMFSCSQSPYQKMCGKANIKYLSYSFFSFSSTEFVMVFLAIYTAYEWPIRHAEQIQCLLRSDPRLSSLQCNIFINMNKNRRTETKLLNCKLLYAFWEEFQICVNKYILLLVNKQHTHRSYTATIKVSAAQLIRWENFMCIR